MKLFHFSKVALRSFRNMFILLVVLAVIAYFIITKSTHKQPFQYLALGDSIAAGISPYSTQSKMIVESSYPDFIADGLESEKLLIGYSKAFSEAGTTTLDLINSINNNIAKQNQGIKEAIVAADLITLDIGANDVFKNASLDSIKSNLGEIIKQIKLLKPAVKIYVIGYYNLLPLDTSKANASIKSNLIKLNNLLKEVSTSNKVTFIELDTLFNDDYMKYLPVVNNVHPNELGHKQIASTILNVILKK